jgi:hypothetical protein
MLKALVPSTRASLGRQPGQHRPPAFVTAIGAGTTYPDYKPAPFIVSQEVEGVDLVTVVTEGIFLLLRRQGEDRHRPASRPRGGDRARQGEAVGHVTTANTARRCCRSAACTT